MDKCSRGRDNKFERHPKKTILLVILVSIFTLDFVVANIYTLINGYPWALRKQMLQEIMETKAEEAERKYRIHSDIYHHDLAKNKCVNNAQWGNITYKVCTNSLGFKDNVVRTIPLSLDKYRILFIGDSFTEGLGVDYKDTFVGLIDAELSRNGIEVLNAAVMSYCPTIYWRKIKYLIEDTGLKFNEVVVFLDLSDIQDEANFYFVNEFGNVVRSDAADESVMSGKGSAEGNDDKHGGIKKILKNAKTLIKNNSMLVYFVSQRFRAMPGSMFTKRNSDDNRSKLNDWYIKRCNWTIDKDAYREYGEKGLKKAELYLDKLHDLLSSHGIGLTVAVYPWPYQIYYGDLDSIQVSFWSGWCTKHDVNFINYFPYFITSKTKTEAASVIEKLYIAREYHWNKNGHRLVADIFLDLLSRRSSTGRYADRGDLQNGLARAGSRDLRPGLAPYGPHD